MIYIVGWWKEMTNETLLIIVTIGMAMFIIGMLLWEYYLDKRYKR